MTRTELKTVIKEAIMESMDYKIGDKFKRIHQIGAGESGNQNFLNSFEITNVPGLNYYLFGKNAAGVGIKKVIAKNDWKQFISRYKKI